jgi:RNA polymerase sigma-70 factor (ECF subfamily)
MKLEYAIPDPTDESLATQVAQGDESALELIVKRWTRPVYSLCLRMLGDPGLAQEVTQDVFFKCWRHAASFEEKKGSFSSWILSVAHHSAIDALRRRRSKGRDAAYPMDELMTASLASPAKGVTFWQKLRMEKALAKLSPAQRQVVEMAYFEGLTREEMAQRLGEPVGTVKTRLRDTLMKLQKLFSDPEQEIQTLPGFKP